MYIVFDQSNNNTTFVTIFVKVNMNQNSVSSTIADNLAQDNTAEIYPDDSLAVRTENYLISQFELEKKNLVAKCVELLQECLKVVFPLVLNDETEQANASTSTQCIKVMWTKREHQMLFIFFEDEIQKAGFVASVGTRKSKYFWLFISLPKTVKTRNYFDEKVRKASGAAFVVNFDQSYESMPEIISILKYEKPNEMAPDMCAANTCEHDDHGDWLLDNTHPHKARAYHGELICFSATHKSMNEPDGSSARVWGMYNGRVLATSQRALLLFNSKFPADTYNSCWE